MQLSDGLKEKIFQNSQAFYRQHDSLRNNYEQFKIENGKRERESCL